MCDKMCQCCLTKLCFGNNIPENLDRNIVAYANLIRETFNVTISSEKRICEQCIKMIQKAFEFRILIIKSQEKLLKFLTDSQIEIEKKNDIEVNNTLWDRDKNDVCSDIEDFNIPDVELQRKPIDTIIKQESKNKGTAKTRESIKIKSAKVDEKPKSKKNQRAIREDSLKLLKHSNMCLFKSLKTRFQCCSCKETFVNMSDLRNHSEKHSIKEIKFGLHGNSYKNVDISSLSCKLCGQYCDDLKSLRKHLENKHNLQFHSAKHVFVEYRLENGLKCVKCDQNFNSFVRLSTHMNVHSANYVCEVCGVSFINRISLNLHLDSMHKQQKCTICSAKFERRYSKVHHMRMVHNMGMVKRYCSICNKNFKYTYQLLEHKIEEHGAKRQTAICKDCGKKFISTQNLKIHIRSVHVKERNFECNLCGRGFFTKRDEKRHQTTHQDVKSFLCNFCEGKFKSKDSWKRHMDRLHNDCVTMNK